MAQISVDPAYADLYRDTVQDEMDRITSGDTVYGSDEDRDDALDALRELRDQFTQLSTY